MKRLQLALAMAAAATMIGAFAGPATAAPPTEPPGQTKLHQVPVDGWDRTVAVNAASIQDGRLTLLAATKVVPADLGARVATLTTTVTTDDATSNDFNLFASGFISRLPGETIARNTLFAPSHDGDPLLYAQDNSAGYGFCWDDKFYDDGDFAFTTGTNRCAVHAAPPGGTYTYVTKISGDNTVTTETFRGSDSIGGPLTRTLPKPASTKYHPLLRTGISSPAEESGSLTISGSTLTVQ